MENIKLKEQLLAKFENIKIDAIEISNQLIIIVSKENLFGVCRALKENAAFEFDYLSFVTAVDRPNNIEVVYELISTKKNHRVRVKVNLTKESPEIDSVTGLWAGANWHERETYDLFGVNFINHPNLTRILTPDDFEGFPFRKDYKNPEIVRMPND